MDKLNNLINSIATPVQEVIRLAVALSMGDVSQRVSIETQGDIHTLSDALNKSFDDLGALIRFAMDSSTQTTEEIATTSEQAAVGAEQMSASIQQQTAGMQQMTTSAQNLSVLSDELKTALKRFKVAFVSSETAAGGD